MFLLIAILAFLFLISLLFARRQRPKVPEHNRMSDTEKESLSRLVGDACRQMRGFDNGNGIRPSSLMGSINRCNAMIGEKLKKNEPVSESEKWFYENYYLVYRYVYSPKDNMRSFPHIGTVPRIVSIAKLIVNHSLGSLTGDKVRYVLENIKNTVSLTFAELRELNNALSYAVLEQIYILSHRLLKQNDSRKRAYDKGFREKSLKSDVYVYWLYHIGTLTKHELEKLAKIGLNEKNALLNFNNITVHNTVMAKTLFGGLREGDSFVPVHLGLKYLSSYQILAEKIDLEEIALSTRLAYFSELERISLKTKISEEYVASKLLQLAKINSSEPSILLFDQPNSLIRYMKRESDDRVGNCSKKSRQRLYVWGIATISAIISAIIGLFINPAVGVLSFIPILFVVENIANYLLSHADFTMETPKMNFKTVPYAHSVMIVVSEFISSLEQLKESIENLRLLNAGNGGENITCVLLADIKGGDAPVSSTDAQITEYLSGARLDDGLNVFIRKKTKINGKYQGKERKRGAIMAFNKLLMTKDDGEFSYIYNKNYAVPRYILTLDADNALMPGEVAEMVSMMAHPYNERFDLLACHSRYSLYSLKTRYSKRFVNECGADVYPTFSGLYYRLFRRDIYCGKGIYRLKNFYNKLEDIFPDGKILSHDIIEGSVLTTGGGTTVFEDAPTGFLSDRERRKRWQRGDLQLLPFIGGRWNNNAGKPCKEDIEPLYQYIMIKNCLGVLRETVLLALILVGLFTNMTVLFFALGLFLAPYAVNQIKILRGIADNVTPRVLLKNTLFNIYLAVEDFFMLGYYAVSNLVLLISCFYRMVRGDRLLEWKTYYHSQNSNSPISYVKEFSLPFAVLTVLGIGLAFFSINATFVGIYLLLSIFVYFNLFIKSVAVLKPKNLVKEDRAELIRYAERTYKYFRYMHSDGAIIADNLQVKPYKGMSKTTSPTNIGFSMLAEICGYYLGFSTLEECCYTLNKILDAVEKLPKWHGNLFNWYDVSTQKPVSRFVSSVDSGNFLACVLIVEEFLRENFDSTGELKARFTVTNTDLSQLFDNNKNLFHLGFDGERHIGHYDLLNSEARILSTVYVAQSGNTEHYRSLRRDYSSYGGNTLLSWSGTMFEALLPDIFFRPPVFSTIYNTAYNNFRAQSTTRIKGVWGISECGYYCFDEELHYQYYAFGLNKLALRNERNKSVITPYAGALCVSYAPKEVLRNLKRLEKLGAFYEYGFYEGVDCEGKERFISSYMSHHQGMILCALTNFLADNPLPRLMQKNAKIRATLNLYNELPPQAAFGIKSSEKQNKTAENKYKYSKYITNIEQHFQSTALTDTQYTIMLNAFGGGFSKYFDVYINKYSGVYEENCGSFFFAQKDGLWSSPTFLPFAKNAENFSFSYTEDEIIHTNSAAEITQRVTQLGGLNGEVRHYAIGGGQTHAAFYMPVALNSFEGFYSHPTFNGMFIEAKSDGNTAILRRRSSKSEAKDFFLGIRVEGLTCIEWEFNNANFIGRNRELSDAKFLFGELSRDAVDKKMNTTKEYYGGRTTLAKEKSQYPSDGDVLSPCIGFRGEINRENKVCQICIVFGESEKSVTNALDALPDEMYSYALLSAQKATLKKTTNELLGETIYLPYSQKQLNEIYASGKRDVFIANTNGKKLIGYEFSETQPDQFAEFIALCRDFRVLRIPVSFVINVKGGDADGNIRRYIDANMGAYGNANYRIAEGTDDVWKQCFLCLNSDLSFAKNKLLLSKQFELKNELSVESGKEDICSEEGNFKTGIGFFDSDDKYVIYSNHCAGLPYSNVVADSGGGFLSTDNGGGFYYFDNSRENKMTRFDNDFVSDPQSEFLYIKNARGTHRIGGGHGNNRLAIVEKGRSIYACKANGVTSTVKHFLVCEGRAKIMTVELSIPDGAFTELIYGFFPALNWVYKPDLVTFSQVDGLLTVQNLYNNQTLYVKAVVEKPANIGFLKEREYIPYLEYYCEKNEKIYFVCTQDLGLARSLNAQNIPLFEERSLSAFRRLNQIDVKSEVKSFDLLADFLPYQIVSSRLNGKFGFYQVGGATGFRDQLQDSLAFLDSNPELVKRQILDSARHQYTEGDVMHWWHKPKFGLRTRITDDKLFLPLAVAEYVKRTQDRDILEVALPFLQSPALTLIEETRFENPPYSDEKASLFQHCLRAVRSALKYGEHGLLVMGSGDWNDGMDGICAQGKGESVFNSMLCYQVVKAFAPLCPPDLERELLRISEELKASVNAFAFEDDRYKRLFSDAGTWLGSAHSEELTLDLLVQSYAVISGIADESRAQTVLNTAKQLVDADMGIIKLLTPPLDKTHYLGYISAYPKGVRENGGQYTHAAMWYLIALTKIGRQDEAFQLFQMLNPVEKCRNGELSERYMGEPYVLSGDVYSNEDNYGRMGWSWYTGSAAWAYRLIFEHFYGLTREGNILKINPHLPKALNNSVLNYRYEDSIYVLEYRTGVLAKIERNGELLEGNVMQLERGKKERIIIETATGLSINDGWNH